MKTFYSHRDETPNRGGTAYLFKNTYGFTQVDNPKDADIIIWNGGEDIATSIYGEQPIHGGIPLEPSKRDLVEVAMFDKYSMDPTKLLIGICRGGQLLNCLNGGKLYQDVNGHGGSHDMVDMRSGELLEITSTHHQQFRPNITIGQVIGVSSRSTAKRDAHGMYHYVRQSDLKQGNDVEIVWYPATRTLCIQGHPEYVPGSRFSDYTLELINEFAPKKELALCAD